MAFTRILKKVLQAQSQSLAAIFCDEEGEMVAMAMQSKDVIDEFEFKVLAANAAVWVQSMTRVQGIRFAYPDMSLRFQRFHVLIQALPQNYYLLLVASRRAPLANMRRLLYTAAQACIVEM